MGIPENADTLKREIAKAILELDDNFGSVYFTTPKGDIILENHFLNKSNYKG